MRGNEPLIWVAFWLLNVGLCLFVLELWLAWVVLVAGPLEAAAVVAYAIGTWRRVKPHGLPT